MKKSLIILAIACSTTLAIAQKPAKRSDAYGMDGIKLIGNVLNSPESVVYDENNDRYFVSNWEDGKIIIIDHLQQQQLFTDILTHVAGLHICNGILYACSYQGSYAGIVGFDINTSGLAFLKKIPGMSLPNGITSDGSEYLYVTGYFANKVYKIKISDSTHMVLVSSGLVQPNGIEYDHMKERLIVMNEGAANAPIIAVDKISGETTTLVETNIALTDGLAIDSNGNTYFSSWATGKVYMYDTAYTHPPEVFSSAHSGPADIFADNKNHLLAVPNFNANTVDFIPFSNIIRIPGELSGIQERIEIKAFPNPFFESICISYDANRHRSANIIEISDMAGKHIKRFEIQDPAADILWDGSTDKGQPVKAGLYLVRVISGNSSYTKKILKIK